MRHLKSGRKFNRTASHRKAMLSNLAVSILDKERVTTTVTKAKEVRGVVERLITYGKKGTIHSIRLAASKMRIRNRVVQSKNMVVKNKDILDKLFKDIAPSYKDREGGYTRIIRLNERKGDNAEMAIIELVGRGSNDPIRKKKKKKQPTQKQKPQQKQNEEKVVEDKIETKEKQAEKKEVNKKEIKKKEETKEEALQKNDAESKVETKAKPEKKEKKSKSLDTKTDKKE